MANELIRMKSGLIKNIEKNQTTGQSPVGIQAGTIYFAVDDNKETGKILYDVDSTHRVVMSTQAEYADYAGEAAKTTGISGIYPVKGTQTATTASWTGVLSGINELFDGLTIAYYLPRTSASNVTLTLLFENGLSTPAVPVYYTGTTRMTTHYDAGSTIILTYWSAGSILVNGTATTEARWTHCDYDSTNIYQLKHNSGPYTAKSAVYRYQLLVQDPTSGTTLLPFNNVSNNTGTTKTLTTESFNPFGQFLYYNSTTTVAANGSIGASALYNQVALDLRYSFNTGTTLTANKDVYIVAVPQDDGSVKLHTSPITQTLPTASDGLVYIYLGRAYNTSAIELYPYHPVYYYKNNGLRIWTAEPLATSSSSGLMSAGDKATIDAIVVSDVAGTSPISVSKSGKTATISHANSGVTAASKGDTSNQTPGFGSTFKVTSGTVNATGHLTAFADHTVKIPDTVATSSVNGLMDSDMYSKLQAIEAGAQVNTITGVKGNAETSYRTGNVNITKANIGLGNVENKSSATIRGELTSANVTNALGYTPATQDLATSSTNGLMSYQDKLNFDKGMNIAGNTIAIGGAITADTLRLSLGLSNAMHFIGIATVAITDGSTTNPTISGYDFGTNGVNAQNGDVVIDSGSAYEYVWTGTKWERLGPDGSYALSDHTHAVATSSANGFMSSDDKSKLNGIAANATNTTISATAPISASASTGAVSITHNTSGVTAQAYGETGNKTPGFGSTFSVPSFTVNATGHVTVAGSHTVKIPNTAASGTVAGLMSSDHYSKVEGIDSGAQVNVIESVKMNNTALAISSKSVNIPVMGAATASAAGTVGVVPAPAAGKQTSFLRGDGTWVVPTNTTYNNATTTTAGLMSAADKTKLNGIADNATNTTISATSPIIASASTGAITLTHATSGPSTTADTSKGDTSNQTPTWGGTFKVTSATVDKYGHTKTFAEHTVTIPNALASGTAAGLMSADHYSKLEGIATGATANTGTVTKITAGTGLNTSANQAESATKGSITTTGTLYLTKSGATAGTYGPAAAATTGTTAVNIPYITVDAYGRVTSISNRTYTGVNTDTLVLQNAAITTAGEYPMILGGTTTTGSYTGTVNKIAKVTANPSTGTVSATKFRVDEAVTLQYNTTTKSLDFIFA